ncbi:MAG: hypothetical protein H6581_20580 [Bacteroidia bacterium]|nr:hypothetical protein [Bacteroidia bacterium]
MGEFIETGEFDVFKLFYNLIFESRSVKPHLFSSLTSLYQSLQELEDFLDLANQQKNDPSENKFNQEVRNLLYRFFRMFQIRGFEHDLLLGAFSVFVKYLGVLTENSTSLQIEEDFEHNFFHYFPSLKSPFVIDIIKEFLVPPDEYYYGIDRFEAKFAQEIGIIKIPISENTKKVYEGQPDFEQVELMEENEEGFVLSGVETEEVRIDFTFQVQSKVLLVYCDGFIAKKLLWSNFDSKFLIIEEMYYSTLDLFFKGTDAGNISPPRFSRLILALTQCVDSVENAKTEIEGIRVGSIIVRIKLWFSDTFAMKKAKENLIDLLEPRPHTVTEEEERKVYKKTVNSPKNPDMEKLKSENAELRELVKSMYNNFNRVIHGRLTIDEILNQEHWGKESVTAEINKNVIFQIKNGKYLPGEKKLSEIIP